MINTITTSHVSGLINLEIEFIKNRNKETITYSQTKTTNITGAIRHAENFTLVNTDGEEIDLSIELIDARITLCLANKLGNAILNRVSDEFDRRAEANNPDPTIGLVVQTDLLTIVSNGYLTYNAQNIKLVNSVTRRITTPTSQSSIDNFVLRARKLKA